MKRLFPVVLTLFCGIGTVSADVVTNTTCQTGNGPITSNPTNCSIGSRSSPPYTPGNLPYAAANITINQLTPVSSGSSFTSFTLNVSGSADAQPLSNIPISEISSNANATATLNYLFSTPGPVRQGVITVSSVGQAFQSGPGNGSASAGVSIGGLSSLPCTGKDGFCQFFSPTSPRSFTFTLGTTFALNFSESFHAYGDPSSEGEGIANGGADLTFQLFEADSKTPVAFSAAPEPSSFSLLLLAAPAAWLYRRRQRR